MKQILFGALSAIALMFGAAQISKAETTLDFSVAHAEIYTQNRPSESHNNAAVALDFALPPATVLTEMARVETIATAIVPPVDAALSTEPADLFAGGVQSLVARSVGSAEGTRTPTGGKTSAYYGHIDPGNGRWNQGSFSYQHQAASPEEADEKQLRRLEAQFEVIRQQAGTNQLLLSLEEALNAIDLANQAPMAALDRGGYVDRLRQARDRGFKGSDAVLQARVYSFLNPRTNQWDAPGLGNQESSISHDQGRRLNAIAQTITIHKQTLAQRLKPAKLAQTNRSTEPKTRSASPDSRMSKSLISSASNSSQ